MKRRKIKIHNWQIKVLVGTNIVLILVVIVLGSLFIWKKFLSSNIEQKEIPVEGSSISMTGKVIKFTDNILTFLTSEGEEKEYKFAPFFTMTKWSENSGPSALIKDKKYMEKNRTALLYLIVKNHEYLATHISFAPKRTLKTSNF